MDEDRLWQLVDRWEELHRQSQAPSIEQLCRDDPDLTDQLREWVTALKATDWVCKPLGDDDGSTLRCQGNTLPRNGAGKSEQRVLGEYVLLEQIGAGGMGSVFKARHQTMDRLVAVKLLPPAVVRDSPGGFLLAHPGPAIAEFPGKSVLELSAAAGD